MRTNARCRSLDAERRVTAGPPPAGKPSSSGHHEERAGPEGLSAPGQLGSVSPGPNEQYDPVSALPSIMA